MGSRRLYIVVGLGCLLIVLGAIYYFFDPAESAWMPRCLWKALTGTDCPGCGSQRMAHALMHGDIAGAWRANAFGLSILPLMLFLIWLELFRCRYSRLYSAVHRPWLIVSFAIAVILWWICRNVFM